MQTPFFPLSFGKSFMKIRSAVPENGCLVFLWRTEITETRLNPFARSWFYNATAAPGALWWLRQSHSVNYANHQHSQYARRRHDFRQAAARVSNYISAPIVWWKFHENPFSRPRERLSHNFGGRKKTKKKQKNKKKQKKTTAKHIRIRLLPEGGCVN